MGQKTNSLIVFDELLITYASHTLQFYEVFFWGEGEETEFSGLKKYYSILTKYSSFKEQIVF